jgi:CheY-like chemotaxis protein
VDADAHLASPFGAGELGVLRTLARLRRAELDACRRAEALQASHQKKDEFIAMLGHELRNPLGAIRAGLSLLERAGADDALAARVRASLGRQTDTLVRLVDDLLDIARIAHGKLSLQIVPVDLREIVDGSVEAARSGFERGGVALTAEIGGARAVLDGDANRLAQVVTNLLDNALKFTPAGGCVHVALELDERHDPRRARLTIRDTGVGIDKEDLANLFQLFFQGDRASRPGGLGIGLTIVRRLVELHGGTVRVSSDGPGLGAEFSIEVPLLPASVPVWTQAASEAPLAPRCTSDRERKVLFVDDHEDSRELFHEVLRAEGHAVTLASDGEQAVTILLTAPFDVAVVDLGLPGLDGYEVARLVRERLGANTPFLVAMTGYGGAREREAAARAGFDVHIVKPVAPETLVGIIAASRVRAESA